MSVICIMQARMGSTRLPGKVMKPILDRPVLWWDHYRVSKCRLMDTVVVATSTLAQDDVIAELCEKEGWNCFRGSEEDVLDRYYQAAQKYKAQTIVRVTCDCPLYDPQVGDFVIAAYQTAYPEYDYVCSNSHFPGGLDTEVFSFEALERAWREEQDAEAREHVAIAMYRTEGKYRVKTVGCEDNLSSHWWALDTPEDYERVKRIYEYFGHGEFSWKDTIEAIDKKALRL